MAAGAVIGAELEIPLGVDPGTGGEPDGGHEPIDSAEGGEPAGGTPTPTEPFVAIKDGKLSDPVKQHLEQLKATNPQLAKAVRDALFANDRWAKVLPGGLKEYQALRAAIDEAGGPDGIVQLRGDLQRFTDLDSAFINGDPKFIAALTDTPENQAAFLRLAPGLIEKYREFHPEGFNASACQLVMQDMDAVKLPLALERLADLIPADNPRAQELLKLASDWVSKIYAVGRTQPKAPQGSAPQPDRRAAELDQRETQLRHTEYTSAADAEAKTVFDAEWVKLMEGRTLTAEKIAAIKELYGSRAISMLKARNGFNDTAFRFFQAKQKDGYLRHVKAAYSEVIPRALKAAFDTIAGPKPGPKPGQQQQNGTRTTAPTAQPGYITVSKSPASAEIDYSRTNSDMVREGKAVLLDGRKVSWR